MFPFAINGDIAEGETREAAEGGFWRVGRKTLDEKVDNYNRQWRAGLGLSLHVFLSESLLL